MAQPEPNCVCYEYLGKKRFTRRITHKEPKNLCLQNAWEEQGAR